MDNKNLCKICNSNPGEISIRQMSEEGIQNFDVCKKCFQEMNANMGEGFPGNFGDSLFEGLDKIFSQMFAPTGKNNTAVQTPTKTKTPALETFGRDLTLLASQGKLDPVIGRDNEIQQAVEILTRRRKNNVVMIGEPGVGKTSVVEGIALQVAKDQVPSLSGYRIIELDLGAMIAGTQFRGQFEQRFKTVLSELEKNKDSIILFIDELHTLVGAGAADGALDAANMLKPVLAKGELQMIGATTSNEFRNHIEKDGALSRRFSTVYLEEPNLEDTITIMQGVASEYQNYHNIKIPSEVIKTTAQMAERYLHEGRMPDKAVDLLDQALSKQRLNTNFSLEVQNEIAKLENAKKAAIESENFEYALECKNKVQELRSQNGSGELTVETVAAVVAARTGIPVEDLKTEEIEKLKTLENDLHQRVIGQEKAVQVVSDAVRVSRAGFKAKNGPTGVFLFLGPTGVGKTELAKTLAQRIFGDEEALLRIDMSEYREAHSVSRLIGSPPGYVGYGQASQLTEPVRRRPHRVILLDEIEKAHPDIWNIFLQVFDDGRLTDGEGRTVNFDDTIIIMTSNLGARQAAKGNFGFITNGSQKHDPNTQLAAVKDVFPPELYNRIDEVVNFEPLSDTDIKSIANRMIDELAKNVSERFKATLKLSPEALEKIAQEGFDAEFGARPLARYIKRTVIKSLTDAVIDGQIKEHSILEFDKDLNIAVK